MTKRLMNYLPNAVAFIYVINSSNAGGLQNDRVSIGLTNTVKNSIQSCIYTGMTSIKMPIKYRINNIVKYIY